MAKKTKKFEEGGSTGGLSGAGIKTGGLSGAFVNAFQNIKDRMDATAAKYPEMVKPEGAAPGAAPLPGAVRIEVGSKPSAKDLYEEHMLRFNNSNEKKDDSLGLDKLSLKKGGAVKAKKMASGGSTASKRADGCAQRGKTRGKMC